MFGLNAVHKYCFALIKMPFLDKNMLSLTVPHWYFDYVHHRHCFSDLYFKILQTHLWLIFELCNADKFSQIKCYNKVGQFGQIIFSAESLNNCISPIMCHDCDWLLLFRQHCTHIVDWFVSCQTLLFSRKWTWRQVCAKSNRNVRRNRDWWGSVLASSFIMLFLAPNVSLCFYWMTNCYIHR